MNLGGNTSAHDTEEGVFWIACSRMPGVWVLSWGGGEEKVQGGWRGEWSGPPPASSLQAVSVFLWFGLEPASSALWLTPHLTASRSPISCLA